jgi:hypothetical protein
VKVGGVVGVIGTVKGREELDERRREQDEYSTRKGVMKFGQGENSKPAMHNDKVGQG